jgi:hypothetical protein
VLTKCPVSGFRVSDSSTYARQAVPHKFGARERCDFVLRLTVLLNLKEATQLITLSFLSGCAKSDGT